VLCNATVESSSDRPSGAWTRPPSSHSRSARAGEQVFGGVWAKICCATASAAFITAPPEM
jgi:hypothetical protein